MVDLLIRGTRSAIAELGANMQRVTFELRLAKLSKPTADDSCVPVDDTEVGFLARTIHYVKPFGFRPRTRSDVFRRCASPFANSWTLRPLRPRSRPMHSKTTVVKPMPLPGAWKPRAPRLNGFEVLLQLASHVG